MAAVTPLSFSEARDCVIRRVCSEAFERQTELVPLPDAWGRILAEDLFADRDYPPKARSLRDGYAVRYADVPGTLRIVGEVRAGEDFTGFVGQGQAAAIMTGGLIPEGADTVVMVEHVQREGAFIYVSAGIEYGQFINAKGAEARRGDCLLKAGCRIGYAEVAMAAAVGAARLAVFRKPRVAILSTGDEVVSVEEIPSESQVRNANAYSLAAQVVAAGGIPEILPVARDEQVVTERLILQGLRADLLLISGGVSAGKYDIVESVLGDLGAEFYFDRVLIQPGQPLVFGKVKGKFFFGLPGNPASTMVTFLLFARPALELLGGGTDVSLPIFSVPLTTDFRHKPGLTRFLPARLSSDGCCVAPIPWQGSSDIPAMARANALMVAAEDRESWRAGDRIGILLK
jgi:molybdopterin molybdotransferase